MKRVIIGCCIFCFIAVQVSAQIPTFTKSDNILGVSIGFGGNLYTGYAFYKGYSRTPAISVYFENCVVDNLFDEKSSIGVGGMLGYTSAKYTGTYGWGWKSTNTIIGARGAFHYAFVDKLDTYAGVVAGFKINTWKWNGSGYTDSDIGGSGLTSYLFVGARYYFNNSFAAFGELGYGISLLNLGVSLKF